MIPFLQNNHAWRGAPDAIISKFFMGLALKFAKERAIIIARFGAITLQFVCPYKRRRVALFLDDQAIRPYQHVQNQRDLP